MSGRLSPDPEAAVSARYYGAVTTEHLDRSYVLQRMRMLTVTWANDV
jgi:hypothetical protein